MLTKFSCYDQCKKRCNLMNDIGCINMDFGLNSAVAKTDIRF